jgi:malonyl CoA-acyl carrier protein transacylase/phosphopantetheinyl transferase
MPAAGMVGVIKTALSLYHRKIAPTLHCEEPLDAMFESRFLPPQEPIDWDGEKIPLVAGVNAFGFGGINSHAILTAYDPKPGISVAPRIKPYMGETLMVSAPDKDALISKLQIGDYTNTGGDYRIVVFDPDEKRIEQAVSIVEKDKPWRGRLDIWFSNKPLLSDGGKIVYLFPGFNLDQVSETDSISDSFGLPRIDETIEELEKQGEENAYHLHCVRIDFTQTASMIGLEKLGIEADIYAGHSVGEWYAIGYAGMTEGDIVLMRETMENYNLSNDYPNIAVNGIDRKTAETWCEQIPGLYLVNDNCPNQIIMCGEPAATDALLKLLEREKIYFTVLPFGSGLHTPLMNDHLQPSKDFVKTLRIHKGKVPVWSATTLEPVPTIKKDYEKLIVNQLTQPVYFRELIEKLYDQEGARVFVQIGLGALTGFVEDSLKEKDFSAVSASLTTRDGADQIRRVLAALFVEGRTVDANFLGVKLIHQVEHNLMILPRGVPLLNELPELSEVVQERYGAAGLGGAAAFDSPSASAHPIHQAAAENLLEAMRTQGELTRIFEQMPMEGMPWTTGRGAGQVQPATVQETAEQSDKAAKTFTNSLKIALEDHPYLMDHAIIRQPADWPFKENLDAVVPFTMTLELLADIARKHRPNKKLVQISSVSAFAWVPVPDIFEGTVKGVWKGPDHLALELVNHARAEFHFDDEWQEPPADYQGDIDIGEEIMEPTPAEELYERYAFHGPRYQSATKTLRICSKGMLNLAKKKEGRGSLLDIMGQQLGLFLHLTQAENTMSFPVRLGEINFYADYTDQEGVFVHTLTITRMSETNIAGDMVLRRDGQIWSVARDFVNQRLPNDPATWNVSLKPQCHMLARELAPGVYHYSGAKIRINLQAIVAKRSISGEDGESYLAMKNGRQNREVLFSRIALKDAVRRYAAVAQGQDEMAYPVQIFLHHDKDGKPFVRGYEELGKQIDGLHVSLAHKGDEAVAMVADHPVGIDLEKIEEKEDGFIASAFTEKERALLKKRNQPEDVIRFWVAKEACSKKDGTGLKGNPKRYEVKSVDGEILYVGKEKIQTMKIGEEYIAGWTI